MAKDNGINGEDEISSFLMFSVEHKNRVLYYFFYFQGSSSGEQLSKILCKIKIMFLFSFFQS